MSKKKSHYRKAALVFEELEPRLLLSADPLAVAAEANVAAVQELVLGIDEDHTAIVQSITEQVSSSVRNELVIIDSRAPNYQQLYNDLIKAQQQGRNIHVVVLDAHRDGIEQINEALANYDKLDAVHIVSHGDDGQLQLGATQLNKTTLQDHAADISNWKDAFSEGGDLLIYGCNMAESEDGRSLVDALGYLTATDVAASDDLTGNKLLGGDWDLEYEAGDIESSVAFSEDVQLNWQGTLDGAAPAAAEEQTDTEEQQQQEQQAQVELEQQQATVKEEQQLSREQDNEEQQAAVTEEQRQEVVFIDDSVSDYQAFIDDLQANSNSSTTFGIILLDSDRNGIDQINETLSSYNEVDALHIISHGYDGTVKLGDTWLSVDNLERHSDSLSAWSGSLTQQADILIYGCKLAESVQGEQFVAELAQLTGADVAASNDITGHALLGGDWDLEYKAGVIETEVAFSEDARQSWASILNTFVVTSTADSGVGSLRQALLDANSNVNGGTPDLITFNITGAGPHIINLASALPAITEAVVIDATTEPDYAGNPVVRIEGASAGAGVNGLTFAAASDNSVVRGLMITGFTGYGIQVNAGADDITIANNWIGTTGTGSTGVGNSNSGLNIQAANTIVGGAGANEGNVITNNGNEGINVTGASATGTIIKGNIIGLDPDGSTGSGNTDVGIAVLSGAHNTIIGGITVAERNLISNNFEGIEINSNNNIVQGNYIGTDITGTLDRGNRSDDGVEIQNNTSGNLIGGTAAGAGNLIAFNARDGVYVVNGTGNAVLGNGIHSNTGLGIDLGANGVSANDANDVDAGANNLQNFPVLNRADTNTVDTIAIDGTINSTASSYFRIEFFASSVADGTGYGEGENYLGYVNVATDAGGNASFSATLSATVANGAVISATATRSDATYSTFTDTSEFAANINAVANYSAGATDDPQAYINYLTSLGPTGYWRLGEAGGGTAVDQTGLNDGVYNGATLGQTGAIAADADSALQFDGLDDYVELAHDPAYLLDDGTVQFWFNTADVTQRADLFSKDALGNLTGGHLSIYLDGLGNIETRLQSASASYLVTSTLPLTNNQWHHVAFSFGTDGMQLYVDGQWQDNDAYTGGLGTTSGGAGNFEPIAIGASTQVSGSGLVTPLQDYFTGTMDEVALFGTALSADQIQNLYAGGLQNYTVAEDNTINVSAAEGVLINDYDQEGDPLTAVLVSGPSNAASFTLNPDGSFDYTPLVNFSGTDTFTYRANDGTSDSNVATVTITVTAENDAPLNTVPATQVVLEDTQTAIAGISVSDPDAGLNVITTQLSVSNGVLDITLAGAATISAGANGSNTLTISGNVTDINASLVSLQYTANANVNGIAADSLSIVTNDQGNAGAGGAQSDTDSVQIDITAVNDTPSARDDRIGLLFDGVDDYVRIGDYAGLNVSTNMTMEAWIKPTGLGTGSKIIINKEGEYEMAINATTGELMWAFDNIDPDWGWHYTGYFVQAGEWTHLAVSYNNGVVDTFANGVLVDSYNGSGAITDNYPAFNQLQIGGRENAITQRFDGHIDEVRIWNTTRTQLDIQTNMNTLLTGGEPGLIGNWRLDEGSGVTVEDQSVFAHHGTLADGVTVGEMPAWQGYVVSEEGTLSVSAVNGVLANDYDIDGDALIAVLVTGPTNAAAFSLNPDGSFTYTPAANFNGVDSFTYRANDGSVESNIATVTIRVDPVNDVPVAIASTVSTTEDNAYSFTTVDFTYFDTEGDALVSAKITNLSLAGGTLIHSGSTSVNSGDTLTAVQLNTLVYTPLANATGTPLATFDFSVNDTGAGIATAQMSINVTVVNDVPEAIASTVSTMEDNAYSFTTVDFTYFDTEGDALVSATITNLSLASGTLTHSGGTTVNNGDTLTAAQLNTLVYTPSANANGTPLATFDFSVNDAGIGSVSAQMSINVTAQPDAAVIDGVDSGAVTEDDDPDTNNLLEVSGALSIIDPDVGEAMFNAGAIGGTYGVITLNTAGNWSYAAINNQPAIQNLAAGATLTDTITISSADGTTHDIVITIMGTNDAPVAGNDVASVNEGGSVLITAAATDSDIDNALDLNSIVITGLPGNGSVVVNGDGSVSYTHDGSDTLVDSFSYTISDISGAISNTATVTLSINPVNDAPTTSGIADVSVNEDAASTNIDLNAAFADSDNLDSELTYSILGNNNIGLFAATGIDNATGQLTLDYAADMNGAAQISIRASDPSGSFVDTLFSVNVAPVNDNPMLQANTGVLMTGTEPATISSAELNVTDIDNLDSELLYTITELPAHGDLMRNGAVLAVNDTFTQAELDSNLVVYTARAAVVADRFGFMVSDNAGGALANNSFNIIVQLNQNNDDGSTSEPPPGDTQEEEDTREEDTGNTDSGGSTAGAGGFGGGYEPFGSTSVPPPPAPAPVLTIDPPPQPVPEQETPVEPEQHTVAEIEQHEVSTFAAVQVKSIDALWSAIDKMKQEMAESADEQTTAVEFKIAAAKSSGVVLTAGVVAWILRSGALLSSLMSTIPLWKGYDPLPILAYKDDDKKNREEEIDEHTIPTSLEELRKLKKLMQQQQKKAKQVDVDSMFGDSTIRK